MAREDNPEARIAEAMTEICDCLAEGNTPAAVHEANAAMLSRMAKRRRRDPAAAQLIDAQMAGMILGFASRLHLQRPPQPAGYTGGPPSKADLAGAFETAYRLAAGKDGA